MIILTDIYFAVGDEILLVISVVLFVLIVVWFERVHWVSVVSSMPCFDVWFEEMIMAGTLQSETSDNFKRYNIDIILFYQYVLNHR